MRLIGSPSFPKLGLLLAASLAVALVACDSEDDPSDTPIVVPEANYAILPTPLPANARVVTDDFVEQQVTIMGEWDALHRTFDQWRTGLTDCHSSAAYEALRGFAVDFTVVTQTARGLPRNSHTLTLADALIDAAEQEEAAYRTLRDRWQPNNLSFFEAVEQSSAHSSNVQRQVVDDITELREQFEDAPTPDEAERLRQMFNVLRAEWKGFHDDYEALLRAAATLQDQEGSGVAGLGEGNAGLALEAVASQATGEELGQVLERLADLPREFELIADSVDRLPYLKVVEATIDSMNEAAQAEMESLQVLADSFEDMKVLTTAQVEVSIERSEDVLAEASAVIKGIDDEDPAENLSKLLDFENSYEKLVARWGDFHTQFNGWRKNEGGCDRTKVLGELDGFILEFTELGLKVRDLPQASHLLPIYNLLTDAAEREEGAIRALRNSWRPFIVDVFKAVDQERDNSSRLRREAGIALQATAERFP